MTHILVPTAPAELIDKLTILRLKTENITDPPKLENVTRELAILQDIATQKIASGVALTALWEELYQINADLWVIEDDLRALEAKGDFGPGFVGLARAVYVTNDERSRVKKEINLLLGSDLVEEKSYTDYRAAP